MSNYGGESPIINYGNENNGGIDVYGGDDSAISAIGGAVGGVLENIGGTVIGGEECWLGLQPWFVIVMGVIFIWFFFFREGSSGIPEYFDNSNEYNEQYLVNLTGGRTQGVYAGSDGFGLNY